MSRATLSILALLSAGLLALAQGCGGGSRASAGSDADTDTDSDTDSGTELAECPVPPYFCVGPEACTDYHEGEILTEYYCDSTNFICCDIEVDTDTTPPPCPFECMHPIMCWNLWDVDCANIHDGYNCPPDFAECCQETCFCEPPDTDSDTEPDTDTDSCTNGVWDVSHEIPDYQFESAIEELSGYTEVTGDLYISSNYLRDLEGLECLVSVGFLDIEFNSILASLDGLNGLSNVGGLSLEHNGCLVNLNGLGSLTSAGGLTVSLNTALPDCEVCELLAQLESPPLYTAVSNNLDDACTPVPDNCPQFDAGPEDGGVDGGVDAGPDGGK